MKLFSKDWWAAARDRAAKSAAQGFILAVGTAVTPWMHLNWTYVAYSAAGMAVLSFATSILISPAPPGTPSPGQ